MRYLILVTLIFTTLSSIASSTVEEVKLSELSEFGVVIAQKGSSDFQSEQFDLLFGVPKIDANGCPIAAIETSFRYNGGFIAYNFLADSFELKNKYASHILAHKSDSLSIGIGARYNCTNQESPSIYYSFGKLEDIEKHFVNSELVNET